ncbi:MAG: hypothetical protein KKA79_07485 [Nanoarchaeota archaeon]|nr:hypothetical protein [Nanoarchaeota archaeon]
MEEVVKYVADGKIAFEGLSGDIFGNDGEFGTSSDYDFHWKTDEGVAVSTSTRKELILKQFITDQDTEEYDYLYSLSEETYKGIFEEQGFIFNLNNSINPYLCTRKSMAFEKGDLKCLLLFEPNKEPSLPSLYSKMISIKCSEGISKALAGQKEVLERLEPAEDKYISRYSYDGFSKCKTINVGLSHLQSCFGYMASFINYDGRWIKLAEGHDINSTCEELADRKIPAECFSGKCWSENLEKNISYPEFFK